MSGKSFIFVRHGQSQANADGIIADAHAPLTEHGIEQARKTANEVKGLGVTTIVCSPYLRAQETAETIAGELDIDIQHIKVLDELRERGLGDCEGKPKSQQNEWYSQADAPTLEQKQDLLDRMHEALNKISSMKGKTLVVGHAISGFYLVEAAKGIKTISDMPADNQISNAAFVEIAI